MDYVGDFVVIDLLILLVTWHILASKTFDRFSTLFSAICNVILSSTKVNNASGKASTFQWKTVFSFDVVKQVHQVIFEGKLKTISYSSSLVQQFIIHHHLKTFS